MRIAGLVAHPVRQLGQRHVDFLPCITVRDRLLERATHAEQPCVTFRIANRKSEMPLAQTRMALFRGIEFWPTRPFAQITLEDAFDRPQIAACMARIVLASGRESILL